MDIDDKQIFSVLIRFNDPRLSSQRWIQWPQWSCVTTVTRYPWCYCQWMLPQPASCSSVICSLDNYINAVRAGLYFELSGNIYRIINTSNTRKYGIMDINIFEGFSLVRFHGENFWHLMFSCPGPFATLDSHISFCFP